MTRVRVSLISVMYGKNSTVTFTSGHHNYLDKWLASNNTIMLLRRPTFDYPELIYCFDTVLKHYKLLVQS
nr:hypothetical protein BgiMline_007208 [Biomphalaria glabrata]